MALQLPTTCFKTYFIDLTLNLEMSFLGDAVVDTEKAQFSTKTYKIQQRRLNTLPLNNKSQKTK